MRLSPLAGVLALLLATAGCSQAVGQSSAASAQATPEVDEAFGAKVRAYLLEHPEVLEEAATRFRQKQDAEAQANAASALAKNRRALEQDGRDHVINPNGRVTLTEFFDYRCGYCKLSAPEVVAYVRANPDVRFVFKDLVIFGEASDYAAAALDASRGSPRLLDIHLAMMAEKALDRAGVDRILRANGVDPTAVALVVRSPETRKHRDDTSSLAQALGINGTPAFIVGDTIVPGADVEAVKAAVAKARKA